MKVLSAGNEERDLACLMSLKMEHDFVDIISNIKTNEINHFVEAAKKIKCEIFQPPGVNDKSFLTTIKACDAVIIIHPGYGQIFKKDFVSIAEYGCQR
jgi:methionyl-tRNA formyltransferase